MEPTRSLPRPINGTVSVGTGQRLAAHRAADGSVYMAYGNVGTTPSACVALLAPQLNPRPCGATMAATFRAA